MIEVHITQNSLTVKGHAGYAKIGSDIYCSAVSALTQGLMHSLDALTEDVVSGEATDGYININFRESFRERETSDGFFFYCCDGYTKGL